MRVVIVLIFLISYTFLFSQNWDNKIDSLLKLNERPKIGLALSGGAAHGLAHIGVIKYLEERNIPIDFITGTSIGAVVGGMYALGYSYEDMEKIVKKYDWDNIITNNVSLLELDPQEKQFHDKIPISLRIENSKILLPEAFFEGYKLDLKVQEIFSAAFLANDFSILPRPFKCYSVDLMRGDVVEHSSGSLAESIRASMAIPSVFTPVRKDSMLLVDGGLLKNFPVQEVRDMGADIVIGSYVGSKRGKIEEVNSMTEILKLTGFLTSLNDTETQKTKCDILIEPSVKDFPILDFSYYEVIKDSGYEASVKQGEKFDELSHLLSNYELEKDLIPVKIPDVLFLEDVIVNPNDAYYSYFILNEFSPLIKTNVNIKEFNGAITSSLATNDIKNIKVVLKEGTLGQLLMVDYSINKESKIGISLNHFDNTSTSIIISGTLRNVLFPKTTARGFLRIGDNSALSGDLFKRVGQRNKSILSAHFHISKFNDPIFIRNQGKKELNHYDTNIGLRVRFIKDPFSSFLISYSFQNKSLQPKEIRVLDIRDFDQNLQNFEVKYEKNNLNEWAYPSNGHWAIIKSSLLHNIHQEVSYTNSDAKDIYGVPINGSNFMIQLTDRRYFKIAESIVSESYISYGFYSDYSLVDYFRFGGTDDYSEFSLPFIGSNQAEYRLQHHLYFMQGIRFKIASDLYFKVVGNILQGRSYNNTYLNSSIVPKWNTAFGIGVSLGYKSVIGPININFGYNDDTREFNFAVGAGYKHIH
jgi:NTE family protein